MKKKLFWGLSVATLAYVSVPVYHILKTKWMEKNPSHKASKGFTNDASQLNLTKIDSIVQVPNDKKEMEIQLKKLLAYARENQLKISIAGAKHSMGGHSIYPDGILLNMLPYKQMSLDQEHDILTIGAGALWEDAIKFLDKHGKSIAVMQAFSSFSVGGSLSVNGHGWQKDSQPISSSVISFSLMKADGQVVNCSRSENTQLFKLALGGYGLFGVILDVKLKVVENEALKFKYIRLNPNEYVQYYKKFISANPKVNLVFGRLRISDKRFLEEATLNFFENCDEPIPPLNQEKNTETQRLVFRGSVNNEYGKRLRWDLEKAMNRINKDQVYSRNDLMNDDVSLIENKDSSSTDLLQEYFIPETHFNQFIVDMKPILQQSEIDLLNITIRAVNKDEDSFLNYAKENVFGFVLLFNQKKNAEQESQMKKLTNLLVDAAMKNKGTFYLPYRLHIDKYKMRKSYPHADAFFQLKKKYDPTELFKNKFYEHYK